MVAEANDLKGDGLLDLLLVASRGNSTEGGTTPPPVRFMDSVYWNTGAGGAAENRWMQIRFSGTDHHRLARARVTAFDKICDENPPKR